MKEPLCPVEYHFVNFHTSVDIECYIRLTIKVFSSEIFTIFNESSIKAQKIFKTFPVHKKLFIVNSTRQSNSDIPQCTKTYHNSNFLEALESTVTSGSIYLNTGRG